MSTLLSNLKGFMSPSKPTPVNGDSQLNNEDKMSRGLKRKADPYDVVADEEGSFFFFTPSQKVAFGWPPPNAAAARSSHHLSRNHQHNTPELTNATQTDEAPQPSSSKSHQRVRSRVSLDAPPPSSTKARQSAGKISKLPSTSRPSRLLA